MSLAVSGIVSIRKAVPVMLKFSFGTVLSLMALTAAATFVITLSASEHAFNQKITQLDRLADKYERLDELDAKVREVFYQDVPDDDVLEGMLAGYVSGLGDKYSVYRSNEALTAYHDNTSGVYTGIGISIRQNDEGFAEIVDVTENSPAQKKGIEIGDVLLEVEGVSLKASYQEAINLIAGEVGTSVTLRIRKQDSNTEKKIALVRSQLDEITVQSAYLPDEQIGYIYISKFRSVTVSQFESARQDLLKQGAKAFIFDVRNNGGGVLSALERMTDPMLPEGELAFSYDRDGNANPILTSDAHFEQMPYVVLVNGNTASASELFACVLRDYADAVLVGEKTFGKGIMQATFDLSGGGVTLTTATYATGKTECYHEIGLEPDVPAVYDSEAEHDNQLDAAIETAKKLMQKQAN